jgi:hypothetical protein
VGVVDVGEQRGLAVEQLVQSTRVQPVAVHAVDAVC